MENLRNTLYLELEKLLKEMEKMGNDPKDASEAYERVCRKLAIHSAVPKARRIRERLVRIAAVLFLPLAAGLITTLFQIKTKDTTVWSEFTVPYGNTRQLTLPDGSILTLNAGSRITYPDCFNGRTREIFLDGEVLADVATDKQKPFIIHSGNSKLKVLGTRFTFKTYKDSDFSEVMLQEGSVQLELKTEECTRNLLMHPGEHVRFNKATGLIETRKFHEDAFGTFVSGTTLSFWNTPLYEVVQELERTFAQKIIITDDAVSNIKVLAFFTGDRSCEDILTTLEATYPELVLRKSSGTYYLTSKK